tara:strand:+ start:812 stop:1015 length:204 start_codon:yes stop_codon:yes gene_type:complete
MSEQKRNISRRGLLKGDWFKIICERGAKEIEKDSSPEFKLKQAPGMEPHCDPFSERTPNEFLKNQDE